MNDDAPIPIHRMKRLKILVITNKGMGGGQLLMIRRVINEKDRG